MRANFDSQAAGQQGATDEAWPEGSFAADLGGRADDCGGTVKLFGWGKPGRFVSQEAHERSLKNELAMTPKTLAELARHGMPPNAELPVEYFFYSNNRERAEDLARDLRARGYSADARPSTTNRNIFVVSGWTSSMPMDEATVLDWTRQMATLGFSHDCDFDGWGTYPKGSGDE